MKWVFTRFVWLHYHCDFSSLKARAAAFSNVTFSLCVILRSRHHHHRCRYYFFFWPLVSADEFKVILQFIEKHDIHIKMNLMNCSRGFNSMGKFKKKGKHKRYRTEWQRLELKFNEKFEWELKQWRRRRRRKTNNNNNSNKMYNFNF